MLTRSPTRAEATVANILAAAERLFLAKNYADVAMDDIAEAAGVTKGALYHHFANKEALYVAMMRADLEDKRALFQTAVESQGTCRDRLRRLTQVFLQLPRQKRDLIKLIRRDINIFRDPVRDHLVRLYQAALPEQIEVVVRDGIRSGELDSTDPRLLSWMHVAVVEVVLTRYAESVFKNQDDLLEFVTHFLFNGAGK